MFFQVLHRWLGIEIVEVSLAERVVSGAGATLAMLLLTGISFWALPALGALAVIASMGASAVLLFAVPHGPLSQPWPVIAGHGFSAFIGVLCARWVPHPVLAAACAVGLSIVVMQQAKCIHPPGGATAFMAVMGGTAIHQLGYAFVLVPVLLNALGMVLLAVGINFAFHWRRYPAALKPPASPAAPVEKAVSPEEHARVLAAVRSLDSFVDVSEEDLLRLVALLQKQPARH
ncbi:MAG: HPP family protein [Prosthecobacter sp.]|jgi:CBS domain-containing membrane protein|uniref:HPP family protein n=1 Tax=Prosthecobacter sp. TaxID=1965333 RepID=UPI0019FB48FE|nr:HPP family protein [Prosthecobacter sp.]MBE2287707.1 HPP family protein [Prosthecobacter sp.]